MNDNRLPFRLKRRPEERVVLLGLAMDLVRPEEVLNFIAGNIDQGRRAIVANHNAHSLYLQRSNAALRAFYDIADMIEIDSVPLLMWARLTGRKSSRRFHRCTYLDWRTAFWRMAANRGWRVFYLGSAPDVALRAAERLNEEFPGVSIAVRDGYFNASPGSDDNRRVMADIAESRPHVLLVGMGMPRQEEWIARNINDLGNCVVLPVGAAFDYEAGVQKAAPRWMGRVGIEWLYRLVSDPKRLFRRYCIEPWALLRLLADDWREARRPRPMIDRRSESPSATDGARRRASDLRGSVNKATYPRELI